MENFILLMRFEDVLRARMRFLLENAPTHPSFEKVGAAFERVSKRLSEVTARIAPVESQ